MVIRDDRCSFEIALREMGSPGTQSDGDLGGDVVATSGATHSGGPFAGSDASVWIDRDKWARFLDDLRSAQ